ncbi:monovalent cation/H(+) antiporter subunit G [Candidatus Halobonum tyrrellensis]|uniref:Monovalent cation/proton antiporter, mnhg/phag subunit n=1 Tax=Candidatus Halobonum tyrrellensis G22 TaxID=1324957 RepID=V4HNC4_9EURY|nr:monovalent cation/H(+) antiporter subunit G [Candidatus Halobonum tyrrellensis]ESP89414.1 monovalent cation/proton antiporter, mnhg/phag subunit [Candidatus Halobonum tyrrellensis G22]
MTGVDPVLLAAAGGGAGPVGPVRAALVIALTVVGLFFLTIGTVGLLRLPNVYNRLHATSKATTLGASGNALAAWVYFGPGGNGLKALVTIAFLFLTAPTGGHMISRAAQRMGVEFEAGVTWPGTTGSRPDDPADDD